MFTHKNINCGIGQNNMQTCTQYHTSAGDRQMENEFAYGTPTQAHAITIMISDRE